MENCLDCSCIEQPVSIPYLRVLERQITKFLTSFVLEGAEGMSKTK